MARSRTVARRGYTFPEIGGGGSPEITVTPSTWDFGSTPVGTPVTKIFTIDNPGSSALVITLPITIVGAEASAFTVTVQPASTSLAPGASTTFTVQADADSVDTFNADISITNNSSENPKLVAVEVEVFTAIYVDYIGGDDGNSGASAGDALQNLSAIPALVGSERIYLATGSHWREKLTIASHYVQVESYGAGARPIIDASDILGGWSKTGGQVNIYESSPTIETTLNYYVSIFEDGAFMSRVASLAACDAAAGSYYIINEGTTNPTIYVHASDSGNPASNGSLYENSARLNAVYAQSANNCRFTGIDMKRCVDKVGAGYFGASTWIEDCYFRQGNQHNVLAGKNSTFYGCTAEDNDPNYIGDVTLYVGFEGFITPADTWTFINCNVTGTQFSSGAGAYLCHRGNSETDNMAEITYANCSASNCANGISAQHTDKIIVNGGTFENISASALGFGSGSEFEISDVTILSCGTGIRIDPAGASLLATNVDITGINGAATQGITIANDNISVEIVGGSWSSPTPTVINHWPIYIPAGGAGNSIKVRGWTANQLRVLYDVSSGGANVADFDSNSYGLNTTSWRLNNTSYSPFASWQAVPNVATGLGQDANSTRA